jgi:hypothetical protein
MPNYASLEICKKCPNFIYCPKLKFATPVYSETICYPEEVGYRECTHSPTNRDIALMESKYPPETEKSARKCRECETELKFVCDGGMWDGYVGFPDIYKTEAEIRNLVSQKSH